MKDLAIVCPSRGRPETCAKMVLSALHNSTADVLVYVDSDDPRRHEYQKSRDRYIKRIGDPIKRGPAVNQLIDEHRDYRMYLVVSDDVTFVRNDWEAQVVAAMDGFGDGIGLVHVASENRESYVNWACVSRRWVDVLGWFNYPGCNWFCQDTILQVLAGAVGRTAYIEPQVIHHDIIAHPDCMERLRHDQDAFLWYMARRFNSDLDKLRAAITL